MGTCESEIKRTNNNNNLVCDEVVSLRVNTHSSTQENEQSEHFFFLFRFQTTQPGRYIITIAACPTMHSLVCSTRKIIAKGKLPAFLPLLPCPLGSTYSPSGERMPPVQSGKDQDNEPL